jgi:hypothetical protein
VCVRVRATVEDCECERQLVSVCVRVRATVEDCECERQLASYCELENAFSERGVGVFWYKILTVIDGTVALQSKNTSLVCATKLL